MDAKIIAFPGCANVPQPPTTPVEDAFEQWYEANLIPLVDDVEELDRLALEVDHAEFWRYARQVRDAITTWPYPDEPPLPDG